MELILTFFEFIAQLPIWGEIWTLGVVREGDADRKRGVQIVFGAEFLALLVIAIAGLALDIAASKPPYYYVWIGAFGVICAQTILGIALLALRRTRKQ